MVLASAERITLDFSGDGLIQFTLDGDLEQALIENYGQIESANGNVNISMRTARKAIKTVINTDGITPANDIEESNGVIRLVSNSHIKAKKVRIEGENNSKIDVRGSIHASNAKKGEKGGRVHILGDHINLSGSHIDVSGDAGGGEVLIGGDYQGQGKVRNAVTTVMDSTSRIDADAIREGDGGKVILWADDRTLFDGKISARGGLERGDGGFVETSGKNELGVQVGCVDTSAPCGKFGDWLMDPASVNIVTGGTALLSQVTAPNCATAGALTIDPTAFTGSATNVSICAQNAAASSITISNAIAMSTAGVGLTLTAGSASAGAITFNNGTLSTNGGIITLNGVVALGTNTTLDTTNAGLNPTGANIAISSTINGASSLSLNGGISGTVSFGAVGATTALTSFTATGATVTQNSTAKSTGALSYTGTTAINLAGNMTTSGGTISLTGPVTLTANTVLDSTNAGGTAAGANITLSSTTNGARTLTLTGGTGGVVSFGALGGTVALTKLTVTGATINQNATSTITTGALSYTGTTAINLSGNITNGGGGGTIALTGPVTLNTDVVVDATNGGVTPAGANITLSSTTNGAHNLNLKGGTGGTVAFGAVGGTTTLTTFTTSGATITQNATAKTTGAISYTGSTAINLGGNLTTSGGTIGLTGPVSLTANTVADTTNAGGIPPEQISPFQAQQMVQKLLLSQPGQEGQFRLEM